MPSFPSGCANNQHLELESRISLFAHEYPFADQNTMDLMPCQISPFSKEPPFYFSAIWLRVLLGSTALEEHQVLIRIFS